MHLCSTLIQRIALSWTHTTVTTPRSKYRLQKVIVTNHVQKCEKDIIWSPFTETSVWEHIHASLWELSLRWTRGLAAVLLNNTDRLRSLLRVSGASLSKCLFIYSRLQMCLLPSDIGKTVWWLSSDLIHPTRAHTAKYHTAWTIVHSTQTLLSHFSQHDREKHGTSSNQQERLRVKSNPPCVPAVHVEPQQTCLFSFTSSGLMLQFRF